MAQTTTLMPEGRQRYFNNDGTPCAGGKLHLYAAGTTARKAAYQDAAGTVAHPNPITLDAHGEAVIYWAGAYKVDLLQADGQQVTGYPVDNLKTDPAGLWAIFTQLAAAAGAALIGTGDGPLDQVLKALGNRSTTNFASVKNLKKGLLRSGKTVLLDVGAQVYCGGYNADGDGAAATFAVVDPSDPVGILSDDGLRKFKRLDGQDWLIKTLAGLGPVFAAHRGYAGVTAGVSVGSGVEDIRFVPENTIQALNFAAARGAWGVEGDTQVTSDGRLVVMHDTTVDRITNGTATGPVSSFTLAQLKAMDVGTYASPRYANARVMDYAEWFYWCRRLGLAPVAEVGVDLTNAQANEFVAAMHAQFTNGKGVVVYGTSLASLQLIRSKSAECAVAIEVGYGEVPTVDVMDAIYALGNAGVAFSGSVLSTTPEAISLADARGLFTMYAIANTPGAVNTCAKLGVDIVISDIY